MARIKYTGPANRRQLSAGDLESIGATNVDRGYEFVRGQSIELPDSILDAIVDKVPGFVKVEDNADEIPSDEVEPGQDAEKQAPDVEAKNEGQVDGDLLNEEAADIVDEQSSAPTPEKETPKTQKSKK